MKKKDFAIENNINIIFCLDTNYFLFRYKLSEKRNLISTTLDYIILK